MFYVVESQDQLEELARADLKEVFLEIIAQSDKIHPVLSQPCLVYIKPISKRKGYILPVNHSEAFNLSYSDIYDKILSKIDIAYVIDAKKALYYNLPCRHVYGLKLALMLFNGTVLDESNYNTEAHNHIYRKHPSKIDINRIIPIAKHYEKWQSLYDELIKYKNYCDTKDFIFYNQGCSHVFYIVESAGIKIDFNELQEHYTIPFPDFSIRDSIIYGYYNLYTLTGRPANSFNGINFNAINKTDDTRKALLPQNDLFFEFDYDSYHIKLLCELVGYKFEEDNVHDHFCKIYYPGQEITEDLYDQSKQTTFHLLYIDKIPQKYESIPFFKMVKEYKNMLWDNYKTSGKIKAIISGRNLRGIETKTQILPYILQNYETEKNVIILKRLFTFLSDKKSYLVNYSYDSFLIDFNKEDGKQALVEIKNILESLGMSVSVKTGYNYKDLISVNTSFLK
jgi:hypothetical protein